MPGAIVRAAVREDAARLSELRFELRSSVRAALEPRDAFVARCTTWMAERLGPSSRWQCWVALDGAQTVGCVWVQRMEKLPNPNGLAEDNAYLSNFFVAESHRASGVGSQLLEAALTWCDTNGIEITFLWPTERSRPIYSRFGFSSAGGIMERTATTRAVQQVSKTRMEQTGIE